MSNPVSPPPMNPQAPGGDGGPPSGAEERDAERAGAARLKCDRLLVEDPFAAWVPSPPFPPEDFKRAAHGAVRDAYVALRALGEKPRREDARAVLKGLVEWFNRADEAAGGVIETGEREDICDAPQEMAHAARQPSLADEIELWRDW